MPHLAVPADPASDETDYVQRDFVNLVATAFLLFIAVLITWTIGAVSEYEKRQRCLESGRRDCIVIAVPPQGLRLTSH
jgi:hypothetical protein